MEPDGNMQTVGADAPKGNDQSMTGPPSATRVTVQEAAEALGITVEAVRSRIKRGKLRREKGEGGTVYVWLDAAQIRPDVVQANDRTQPDSHQADDQTRSDTGLTGSRMGGQAELVDSLLDQVAYMREQLAEEREARRRADTIIAQLTHANATLAQRVPELEAPAEPREAPVSSSEEADKGQVRPEQKEPTERCERSWWRAFFGLE
jgi:hypothetical protein